MWGCRSPGRLWVMYSSSAASRRNAGQLGRPCLATPDPGDAARRVLRFPTPMRSTGVMQADSFLHCRERAPTAPAAPRPDARAAANSGRASSTIFGGEYGQINGALLRRVLLPIV